MLNPSTADERANDPTIARCERRSRVWGFGAMVVVNLFGFRATRPSELWRTADPVGPETDRIVIAAARGAAAIVCAWGVHGRRLDRDAAVRRLLGARPLACLGRTCDGQPRHPLYVATEVGLSPFP